MPKPYSWKNSGKLSRKIWQANQKTTLTEAKKSLRKFVQRSDGPVRASQ
ncbi:ClbS/DfsB family four-helix bundle protein [Lacticaseibacillus camelliae]